MTTAKQIFLKDLRDSQPDKLISTLNITLNQDQQIYLYDNKLELRTPLCKMFNLKFNTTYTKMQITRALETLGNPHEEAKGHQPKKIKPKKVISKSGIANVYWSTRRKTWQVQFQYDSKIKTVGYFKDIEQAKQVADEYRKSLAVAS